MNIMMNRGVVLGSRKAIEQPNRVKKVNLPANILHPTEFHGESVRHELPGVWAVPFEDMDLSYGGGADTLLAYGFYVSDVKGSIKEVGRWRNGRTREGRKYP